MIEEVVISDWKDIDALQLDCSSDIFRGQSNAKWDITTSLSRTLNEDNEFPENTEFWFLREFKKGARHYLTDLPEEHDTIGWLALMQHYGTPTRLIDFSHSFYVALYFALIDAKSDAAVWVIPHISLLEQASVNFGIEWTGLRDEWEDRIYSVSNRFLTKILSTASTASEYSETPFKFGVVPVEPLQFNHRLRAQQGLFLMPLNLTQSLDKNLSYSRNNRPVKITKIIIKNSLRFTALSHLKQMNITADSLFPGIEGFARSIPHKNNYV